MAQASRQQGDRQFPADDQPSRPTGRRQVLHKLRQLRWPEAVLCPHCEASLIMKPGHNTTPAGLAEIPLCGLPMLVLRLDRDCVGRQQPAVKDMGIMFIFHLLESIRYLLSADRVGLRTHYHLPQPRGVCP